MSKKLECITAVKENKTGRNPQSLSLVPSVLKVSWGVQSEKDSRDENIQHNSRRGTSSRKKRKRVLPGSSDCQFPHAMWTLLYCFNKGNNTSCLNRWFHASCVIHRSSSWAEQNELIISLKEISKKRWKRCCYIVTWGRLNSDKEVIPSSTRKSLHERLDWYLSIFKRSFLSKSFFFQWLLERELKRKAKIREQRHVWFLQKEFVVRGKEQNYYENTRRSLQKNWRKTTLIEFWFLRRIIPSMTHS
jgi:hypothetical protein